MNARHSQESCAGVLDLCGSDQYPFKVIEGVVLPLLDPEAIARAVHDPRACAVWIAAADAIRSALDLVRRWAGRC